MFFFQKHFPFFAISKEEPIDPEYAHTLVELMISVPPGGVSDSAYYEAIDRLNTAKRAPDYRAKVDWARLPEAREALAKKTWMSLQGNGSEKRITNLEPLEMLHQIHELVISDNRVRELGPLGGLLTLERLSVGRNEITNLIPLSGCIKLKSLELKENPVADFSPISKLPLLTKLVISNDQVAAFKGCAELRELEFLEICGTEDISSFAGFPEMPKLRVLKVEGLQSLGGIERFPLLANLTLRGDFKSLNPIGELRQLTHLSLHTSQALELSVLVGLYALRDLGLHAPSVINLTELGRLPALHDVGCWGDAANSEGLAELRKSLSAWDHEFLAAVPRSKPFLQLEVVSKEEFERYDSNEHYGITPEDDNPGLLGSEHGWILEKISASLADILEEKTDFDLPWRGGGRRSDTLIIYSLKAYRSFREIVRRVQLILGEARNDWIFYFQSSLWEGEDDIAEEMKDFIVWIYPRKIQTTSEQATLVRELMR